MVTPYLTSLSVYFSLSLSLPLCLSTTLLLLCALLKFPIQFGSGIWCTTDRFFFSLSPQPCPLHPHFRSTFVLRKIFYLFSALLTFTLSLSHVILTLMYQIPIQHALCHDFPLSPLRSLLSSHLHLSVASYLSHHLPLYFLKPFPPLHLLWCRRQSPPPHPPKEWTRLPPFSPLCRRQNGHASVD